MDKVEEMFSKPDYAKWKRVFERDPKFKAASLAGRFPIMQGHGRGGDSASVQTQRKLESEREMIGSVITNP